MSTRTVVRVAKGTMVVFDYALYDADGDLVEDTEEDGAPVRCVWGHGVLVPGLERGLLGLAPGETREIEVAPEDAYGPHDEEKEQWFDRADFPPELAVEDELDAEDADGEPIVLRVVEIEDDAVLVDGNHPLAGETLRFDVIVREVRPATEGELAAARAAAPKARLPTFVPAPPATPERAADPEPPTPAAATRLRRGPAAGDPLLDDEQ
ncbi:MAG: hypothetical protein NVSMB47_22760 [Polyangiales bacterium]